VICLPLHLNRKGAQLIAWAMFSARVLNVGAAELALLFDVCVLTPDRARFLALCGLEVPR
jgi:hypothetical protein